jgi:hypothetical protein
MVKMNCALMRATVSAAPAIEVQAALTERSRHRSVPLPGLLVAACAESAGLTVLHDDADHDRIAEVTGQPTESVVRRGAVD